MPRDQVKLPTPALPCLALPCPLAGFPVPIIPVFFFPSSDAMGKYSDCLYYLSSSILPLIFNALNTCRVFMWTEEWLTLHSIRSPYGLHPKQAIPNVEPRHFTLLLSSYLVLLCTGYPRPVPHSHAPENHRRMSNSPLISYSVIFCMNQQCMTQKTTPHPVQPYCIPIHTE